MCVLYIDPLLDFEQSVLYSRIVEILMAKTAVRKYRGRFTSPRYLRRAVSVILKCSSEQKRNCSQSNPLCNNVINYSYIFVLFRIKQCTDINNCDLAITKRV